MTFNVLIYSNLSSARVYSVLKRRDGPGWRPVTVRWVLFTVHEVPTGELPDFPWLQLGQKEYKNKVDSG